MKKTFFTTLFILMISSFAVSQDKFSLLEKVKNIKVFESNQKDVQKLLPKYSDAENVGEYSQVMRTEIGYLTITFSGGNCGEGEYWNVAKGLVTGVAISTSAEVRVKDLGFNLKAFKKEIEDKEFPQDIDYHDEKSGVFIETDEGEVEKIIFYPPKSKIGLLCVNENAADLISGLERLVDTVPMVLCLLRNMPPIINQITLGETEVVASAKNKEIEILVGVSATDPEGDVLTYIYKISGGKILGQGSSITWDLTGVKPGAYTITAGVDDGSGVTNTKTKTVIIR